MECSAPSICCVHSAVPATKDSSKSTMPTLVNVFLTAEDLQNTSIDTRNANEEEIARQIDALATRLKIAQFIAKTLTSRSEELQLVLSTLKQSNSSPETESSNDEPTTPPNIIESPFPINRSMDFSPKASIPPILQRRHTTTAASLNLNLKDRPTTGWEERAAAFMLKRRNQQSAMESMVHTPMPRSNPFEDRRMSRSPEARPAPARSASDQNPGGNHDQDVLWELERRKQNPRRGALIAAGWITYQDSWDELNAQMARNDIQPYLTFATVPWPVLRMSNDPPFKDPSEIRADDVRDFILSPFHSSEKSKESRVRDSYMRWHPDKSSKWLAFVVLSERAKVKEGMEKVNWCLNNLR